MEELFTILADVGIATTAIALITIFLVGCIKLIPSLKQMKSEQGKKAIYQVLNLVMASALSIPYHIVIAKGTWDMNLLSFISVVAVEVNALYPLYENLGIRALLKKIVSLLIPSRAAKINQVIDSVSSVEQGTEKVLTSEQIKEKQEKSEKTGWLE